MRRAGPLKTKTPLARKTAITRRRADEIPLGVRAALQRRSGGHCEAYLEGCHCVATEIHHLRRRSQGGTHSLVNLAHLCHWCHHVKIHARPEWAYTNGWLVRSGSVEISEGGGTS